MHKQNCSIICIQTHFLKNVISLKLKRFDVTFFFFSLSHSLLNYSMRLITIAAAGLILLKPSLIHCQDSAGLMRLAANAGNFVDTGNAISTNSDVDQECLSDLPEVVMAWVRSKNLKLNNYLSIPFL